MHEPTPVHIGTRHQILELAGPERTPSPEVLFFRIRPRQVKVTELVAKRVGSRVWHLSPVFPTKPVKGEEQKLARSYNT